MTTPSQQPSHPCSAAQAKDELVQRLGIQSSWLARELTQTASCARDPMSGKDTVYFRVQAHADIPGAEAMLKRLGATEPPRRNFPGELVYKGNPVFVVAQPSIQLHDATLPKPQI